MNDAGRVGGEGSGSGGGGGGGGGAADSGVRFEEEVKIGGIHYTKIRPTPQTSYFCPSILLYNPTYNWATDIWSRGESRGIAHLRFRTDIYGRTYLRMSSQLPNATCQLMSFEERKELSVLRSNFNDGVLLLKPYMIGGSSENENENGGAELAPRPSSSSPLSLRPICQSTPKSATDSGELRPASVSPETTTTTTNTTTTTTNTTTTITNASLAPLPSTSRVFNDGKETKKRKMKDQIVGENEDEEERGEEGEEENEEAASRGVKRNVKEPPQLSFDLTGINHHHPVTLGAELDLSNFFKNLGVPLESVVTEQPLQQEHHQQHRDQPFHQPDQPFQQPDQLFQQPDQQLDQQLDQNPVQLSYQNFGIYKDLCPQQSQSQIIFRPDICYEGTSNALFPISIVNLDPLEQDQEQDHFSLNLLSPPALFRDSMENRKGMNDNDDEGNCAAAVPVARAAVPVAAAGAAVPAVSAVPVVSAVPAVPVVPVVAALIAVPAVPVVAAAAAAESSHVQQQEMIDLAAAAAAASGDNVTTTTTTTGSSNGVDTTANRSEANVTVTNLATEGTSDNLKLAKRKRTYQKLYGLSQRALSNRKVIFNHILAQIHFCDSQCTLDYVAQQRFLTAFNHFQVHNKSISYYVASNDFLEKFQVSIESGYRCLSCQPQLVNNQLAVIITLPLTVAQKRDSKPVTVFICTYSNDLEIYAELMQRAKCVNAFKYHKFEHIYFAKDPSIAIEKPINTLVFSLYLLLLLIQTKFPAKMLRIQLERISFAVMKQCVETELNRVCGASSDISSSSVVPSKKGKSK